MKSGSKTSKGLIREACREILENPAAKPREKLQAATLLEKLLRFKELARARKSKMRVSKNGQMDKNGQLNDILRQVHAN